MTARRPERLRARGRRSVRMAACSSSEATSEHLAQLADVGRCAADAAPGIADGHLGYISRWAAWRVSRHIRSPASVSTSPAATAPCALISSRPTAARRLDCRRADRSTHPRSASVHQRCADVPTTIRCLTMTMPERKVDGEPAARAPAPAGRASSRLVNRQSREGTSSPTKRPRLGRRPLRLARLRATPSRRVSWAIASGGRWGGIAPETDAVALTSDESERRHLAATELRRAGTLAGRGWVWWWRPRSTSAGGSRGPQPPQLRPRERHWRRSWWWCAGDAGVPRPGGFLSAPR